MQNEETTSTITAEQTVSLGRLAALAADINSQDTKKHRARFEVEHGGCTFCVYDIESFNSLLRVSFSKAPNYPVVSEIATAVRFMLDGTTMEAAREAEQSEDAEADASAEPETNATQEGGEA